MGLTVWVHRSPLGDSTNGGLSGRFDRLTVVNIPDTPFDPDPDRAPAVLLTTNSMGNPIVVPAVESGGEWFPLAQDHSRTGPMFGGNFAASSDARWNRAVEKLAGHRIYGALPIHDRSETWADYEALSR